jgi:hypothetical protein
MEIITAIGGSSNSPAIAYSVVTRRGQKGGSLIQAPPHYFVRKLFINIFHRTNLVTEGVGNKTYPRSRGTYNGTHAWKVQRPKYICDGHRYMLDDLYTEESKCLLNFMNSRQFRKYMILSNTPQQNRLEGNRIPKGGEC